MKNALSRAIFQTIPCKIFEKKVKFAPPPSYNAGWNKCNTYLVVRSTTSSNHTLAVIQINNDTFKCKQMVPKCISNYQKQIKRHLINQHCNWGEGGGLKMVNGCSFFHFHNIFCTGLSENSKEKLKRGGDIATPKKMFYKLSAHC